MTQSGQCFYFDKLILTKSIRVGAAKKLISSKYICSAERQNKLALTLKSWVQRFQRVNRKYSNSINYALSIIPINFQPSTWLYLITWFSISRSQAPTKKNDYVIKSGAQDFNHFYDHWRLGGVEMRLSDGQNLVASPITDSRVIRIFIFVGFWFWIYLHAHSDFLSQI